MAAILAQLNQHPVSLLICLKKANPVSNGIHPAQSNTAVALFQEVC